MLRPESWKHHTVHLSSGQRVRTEHDCGPGRVLLVSNKDSGYSAYCFRCTDDGFIPHPAPSLSDRLAALERARNAEVRASSSVALPEPAQYDFTQAGGIPLAARVWLYKAGLSNDDIERLGAYYHQPTGRVILPVYKDGKAVYWQGRDVTWTRKSRSSKYINPPVDKTHLCAKYGAGPVIVLTEDILSAFRVSRVTEAWSLLGTALAPGVMMDLVRQERPVVFMFDPDAGGQKANTAALHQLSMMGTPAYIARPRRDPKYLTAQETRECIASSLPSGWPSAC